MPLPPYARLQRLAGWRPVLRPEALALLASLLFALAYNHSFWKAVLQGQAGPTPWLYAPCVFFFVVALQYILLVLLLYRWTARPLLSVLVVLSAATAWFADRYGAHMDAAMMRNVLATDWQETRELLSWDMPGYFALYAGLPLLALWRVRLRTDPPSRTWLIRPVSVLLALLVAMAALWPVTQTFVPLVREQKEIRYLLVPGNYLYALARLARQDSRIAGQPRIPVGLDATQMPPARGHKPVLLLIVVGETVRAANWGLDGYARQTTPELAATPGVINFTRVESCGTNTETSLPCMFSPLGRHDYDEERIRGSESLLHVLDHAGVDILWRDNQSGCKGVCDGLPNEVTAHTTYSPLCNGERCFDEILLAGMDERIAHSDSDTVIVLHELGNHGPAYFQRYPAEFRRFLPTCDTSDLGQCTHQQIVNSYDNAILYTDHLLASAVALLDKQGATHDTALIYLSDHGESLGEKGLYLHSLPRAIAPEDQTHVPMLVWMSPGFVATTGIDTRCLRRRAGEPASHDHLFHTVLGMLDVHTTAYDPAWDLVAGCRQQPR